MNLVRRFLAFVLCLLRAASKTDRALLNDILQETRNMTTQIQQLEAKIATLTTDSSTLVGQVGQLIDFARKGQQTQQDLQSQLAAAIAATQQAIPDADLSAIDAVHAQMAAVSQQASTFLASLQAPAAPTASPADTAPVAPIPPTDPAPAPTADPVATTPDASAPAPEPAPAPDAPPAAPSDPSAQT